MLKKTGLAALAAVMGTASPALAGGMSGCGMSSGGCLGLALAGLVVGYWVLTLADRQERPLHGLGRVIGAIVLLAAVAALIFSGWRLVAGGGACAVSAKTISCPYSGAAVEKPAP